ncbi:hypothetical protein GCM10025780_14770 [Frondihabitans cladoniiphilus]|uniref:Uncharacterized protein n=1 Tax=Frondihabitans cladoniiphilus TaxID=715785 RepID=A0ABP8VVX3_9MICO
MLDVEEEGEREHAEREPGGQLRGDDPSDPRRLQKIRIGAHEEASLEGATDTHQAGRGMLGSSPGATRRFEKKSGARVIHRSSVGGVEEGVQRGHFPGITRPTWGERLWINAPS